MRTTKKVQKSFFLCAFVIFTSWYLVGFQISPRLTEWQNTVADTESVHHTVSTVSQKTQKSGLKYILQWTKPYKEPYIFMRVGQDIFFERHCSVTNCYVTWNQTYLSDITQYDAILFYSHDLSQKILRLPKQRSLHQKYFFVSSESAAYNPIYQKKCDGFFNLTWTYKLSSDIYYGYILIRNKRGDIIGPKEVMHWPKVNDMKPINSQLREKLSGKKIAAAWFVSNCRARSGRQRVAKKMQQELSKYNMRVDIYGNCGNKRFPANESSWRILETDYYFYLSFENSISEDYVTEKLLNALQHYTVPIVFGGANYTRFMPDGIYLDAKTLTIKNLVKRMVNLINDKEKYYDYFRWNNHYTYHYAGDTPATDYYCNFCEKINDANLMNQITIYQDLSKWWNNWHIENNIIL